MTPSDLHPYLRDRIEVAESGCWLWHVGLTPDGYGSATLRHPDLAQYKWRAHRLVYTLLAGPIPDGLQLDHLCRVRNCVNPGHLEPVTAQENVRRSASAAFWRSKTHCPQRHPYDARNTGLTKRGARICRTCARDKMRARRAARAAEQVQPLRRVA